MLDKSFVEKIIELADVSLEEVDGRTYAPRQMFPVQGPVIPVLKIHTLAGVVAAIKAGFAEPVEGSPKPAIHVINHENVEVVEPVADEWNRLMVHIHAAVGENRCKFQYGKWYDTEEFIIELQTSFVETDTRKTILKMVSAISSNREVKTADDGVSQQVTLKAGVVIQERADVPNPIVLRPYRTFIDVGQPESSFVFRIRGGDGQPTKCALFEADGGHWKLDAMTNIAKFFTEALPGTAVIA